jgi:hypothetical protein
LTQRKGFEQRGQGVRWKASRRHHVMLEDLYVRANWDEIVRFARCNGPPFYATGEKIQTPAIWCVYEFERQLDAIQFWKQFNGRWLRGSEFIYPEPPKDFPPLKLLKGWAEIQSGQRRRT